MIHKKDLTDFLSKEIENTVKQIIDLSVEIDESLRSLNFKSVQRSVLKASFPKEMARMSQFCGNLQSYYLIADQYDLCFSDKINELEAWADLITPFLETSFADFYKKYKTNEKYTANL